MKIVTGSGSVYSTFDTNDERSYQQFLCRLGNLLFPGYTYQKWEPRVRDNFGRVAQPDAVLVKNDSTDWYVVEVEYAAHSLQHIRSQFEILAGGIYDFSLVRSLGAALGSDDARASSLISARPGFLSIFDTYVENRVRTARLSGFDIAIIEPYLSRENLIAAALRSAPSWVNDPVTSGRFQVGCTRGIGRSVTLELPRGVPISPGRLTLMCPDGTSMEVCLHGGKIRVPTDLIQSSRSYHAEVIAESPPVIKLYVLHEY